MNVKESALTNKANGSLKNVHDQDDPDDDSTTTTNVASVSNTNTTSSSVKKPRLSKKAIKRIARARRKSEAKKRWVSVLPATHVQKYLFFRIGHPSS